MLNNIFNKKVVTESCTIKRAEFVEPVMENFFLEFLFEEEVRMNNAMLENSRVMHLGEVEDSVEIVMEGFGDFIDNVVEFFKRMLQKIKDFFGKMFIYLNVLLGNTKEMIKKYKHVLMRRNITIDIMGNNFTIKEDSPNLKPLEDLLSQYNRDIHNIKDFKLDEIVTKKNEFMKEENLEKLRGEILGTGKRIPYGELRSTVEEYFKDGDDEKISIDVTSSVLSEYMRSYDSVEKLLRDCEKEKKVLETQITGLKNFFQDGVKHYQYTGGDVKSVKLDKLERRDTHIAKLGGEDAASYTATVSTVKLVDMYYKYKYVEAKEIGNTVLTIMEIKCRCLKEQMKQTESVIKKWIWAASDKSEKEEK